MNNGQDPQTMSTTLLHTTRLRPVTTRLRQCSFWLPLLILLALTLSTAVQAQFSYQQDNGTITITGYAGVGGDVTIPRTLNRLPVTGIAYDAFGFRSSLTSVSIPDSVTFISDFAFLGCSGLTRFTVAADNSSYASRDGVLFDKNQATLIKYPDGKEGTDFSIPESVTSIRGGAFSGCTKLTRVTIGNSVTSIGGDAFSGCTKLTRVTIGNSVTSISVGAFYGCIGLTSATIPDSVISIGVNAFNGCTGLTSVTIPNSVTSIGNSAFNGCTGLTSVTIPDSVTSISSFAFGKCTMLTRVTIGNSVNSIDLYAFSGCTGLTSITIPASVTLIAGSAFADCTGLTSVYFDGNAPRSGGDLFYRTLATVFYLQGTQGWMAKFDGRPTVALTARIVTDDGQFGLPTGRFEFTVAGAAGATIVVEASADLGQPNWAPVSTNTFNTLGKAQFVDPAPADRPGRFYRVRVP